MANENEKVIRRAKVILKKATTYTLAGRKFIKNVPAIVKGGAMVDEFKTNGFFKVTELEPKAVKKKKKSSDDEGSEKKSKSSSKKLKKKTSGKKAK